VPDLAFSEMEFLRHSKYQPEERRIKKGVKKSREKEKPKSQRLQDKISTLFRVKKQPLYSIDLNATSHRLSDYDSASVNGHQRYQLHDRCHPTNSVADSSSTTGLYQQLSGFEKGAVSPKKSLQPCDRLQCRSDSREIALSFGRRSDRATTYFTWSDSNRSPVATAGYFQSENDPKQHTSTPESVRRSLENTGVFDGTGIDRGLRGGIRWGRKAASHDSCENSRLIPPPSVLPMNTQKSFPIFISSQPGEQKSPAKAPGQSKQAEIDNKISKSIKLLNIPETPHLIKGSHEQAGENGCILHKENSVVEKYDPKNERPKSISIGDHENIHSIDLSHTDRVATSRIELGQLAYIKRYFSKSMLTNITSGREAHSSHELSEENEHDLETELAKQIPKSSESIERLVSPSNNSKVTICEQQAPSQRDRINTQPPNHITTPSNIRSKVDCIDDKSGRCQPSMLPGNGHAITKNLSLANNTDGIVCARHNDLDSIYIPDSPHSGGRSWLPVRGSLLKQLNRPVSQTHVLSPAVSMQPLYFLQMQEQLPNEPMSALTDMEQIEEAVWQRDGHPSVDEPQPQDYEEGCMESDIGYCDVLGHNEENYGGLLTGNAYFDSHEVLYGKDEDLSSGFQQAGPYRPDPYHSFERSQYFRSQRGINFGNREGICFGHQQEKECDYKHGEDISEFAIRRVGSEGLPGFWRPHRHY
jgi:hypothetical protein